LAGGAVSGGAFKAGGLRALDEALVKRRVPGGQAHAFGLNEFDVFVGLSAGSVLASVLAAGIDPDEVLRILGGTSEVYEAFGALHFMSPNWREPLQRLRNTVRREQELFTNWLSGATDTRTGHRLSLAATGRKMIQSLARVVPTGLFDPRAFEQYLRRNIARTGIADDFVTAFRQTGKELYLTATDLDRGEIVVFGHDEPYAQVPISTAIAASCALPLWYRPMRVAGLDLVDGGLMRTANVRVAVEKGCDLVVCYNPFTRIRYDRAGRNLYEHGLVAIASQAVRTMIGARLDLAKEVVFLDDDVEADVVFIEPAEDDYTFFGMSALNFWTKDRAAAHGYRAVRESLEASHGLLSEVFSAHGIELRTPPDIAGINEMRWVAHTDVAADLRESRGNRR
jgi:predicted acylesterase/phospholipase RssA